MSKAIAYEIVNHGVEHSQFFQGCGTSLTDYDLAVTGIGDNAKQAYLDAVEQCYQLGISSDSLDKLLPKRPRGINSRDKVPADMQGEDSECYYHVSIRLKVGN